MDAPEKRAIIACNRRLVDDLAEENINRIAHDLENNNLISGDDYRELIFLNKTNKQKARDVVSNVTRKVNANPENFMKFIKVLKDNKLSGLAKHLKDKFGECIGDTRHNNT